MKKILYIRGQKDYFLGRKDWRTNRHVDVFNFANRLSTSWKETIFNLWDKTFNVSYLSFRQKLRNLSLQNTKDINYFDLILYNDTEYNTFLAKKVPNEDFVIFTQDDDDFILPAIHDISINDGLNVYIWVNLHYWKGQNKVNYNDYTPTSTNRHKIKSSHYCYSALGGDLPASWRASSRHDPASCDPYFDLKDLSNHRKISEYSEQGDVTYHNTYFNLYIWHPSSLCFLNTLAGHWQFIGSKSPFSFEEQQDILKLNVERIRRLMKITCKNEKDENNLKILKQVDNLYNELF